MNWVKKIFGFGKELKTENNSLKEEILKLLEMNKKLSDKLEGKIHPLEEKFNNKYQKTDQMHAGRWMYGYERPISCDIRDFFTLEDSQLKTIIKSLKLEGKSDNEKAYILYLWVRKNIKYLLDDKSTGKKEHWNFPFETLIRKEADCIANYEEIYTKEGIKEVGNLAIGDKVLSYDFDKREFIYKPIIKIWEKGILNIKRVHLRNGQYIDITNNHPLLVRTSQKESIYEKIYLKDIDLTRWWKRKIPIAKEIPYEIKDIDWLNLDLCFILGHFLAEGSIGKSHIETSGYDCPEKISPLLEKNSIPFSEKTNGNGVPIINFLKSDFKEFLKRFKGISSLSFSAKIPEELFHLPKEKLQKILDGYFLGDGTKNVGKNQHNKEYVLSTSSEQLSKDFQRIALQLGFSFHIWKQNKHGGVGTKPIWRLTYNPQSCFLQDHGYDNISEVSISYLEDIENTKVRDFEVEDTHTFIFKNGVISHQCEDQSILLANLMQISGIPYWKIRLTAGLVWNASAKKEAGHVYVTYYIEETDKWVILDTTYYPTNAKIEDRSNYKKEENYRSTWFSWNSKYCFFKDTKDLKKIDRIGV